MIVLHLKSPNLRCWCMFSPFSNRDLFRMGLSFLPMIWAFARAFLWVRFSTQNKCFDCINVFCILYAIFTCDAWTLDGISSLSEMSNPPSSLCIPISLIHNRHHHLPTFCILISLLYPLISAPLTPPHFSTIYLFNIIILLPLPSNPCILIFSLYHRSVFVVPK